MAKKNKRSLPVAGVHYTVSDSGVIRIAPFTTAPTERCGEGKAFPHYLGLVDHTLAITKSDYKKRLAEEEKRFNLLVRQLDEAKRSLIVVLQGRDSAGKSGAAKKILEAIDFDPKLFLWVPIGPPTEDEKAHGHLWRFYAMDRMPRHGQIRVFDRSWAERGLVEPVMKIIDEETLNDSYADLRVHEWALQRQGAVVVKIWMDISKGEQKKRFKDRLKDKPWKYSELDATARKNWDKYTTRADALFHFTGTPYAPWYILSSENKDYSRVNALATINDAMEAELKAAK